MFLMVLRHDPYYDGILVAFEDLGASYNGGLHLCRSELHLWPPKYSKWATLNNVQDSGGYVGVDILAESGIRPQLWNPEHVRH